LASLGVVNIEEVPDPVLYEECRKIINEMESQTRRLLSENLPLLEKIASVLMEEESIDQQRFQGLVQKAS